MFYKWLRLLANKELKLGVRFDTDPPKRVQNSNFMLDGIGEYDVLRRVEYIPQTKRSFVLTALFMLQHCMSYMINLLTAIGLTPSGSSTVHIYTQTIYRTMQLTQTIHRTPQLTNWEECGPCPVFASYTLAFALQLRKKHGKTSVRMVGGC